MKRVDRLKAERQFAGRQEEFLVHIESLLSDEFHANWIPALAKTCRESIRDASEQEKTYKMKQVLRFMEAWKTELRINILRDLARFVRKNSAFLRGSQGEWMAQQCRAIWTRFSAWITKEHYRRLSAEIQGSITNVFSENEMKAIDELCVCLEQGAKIPAGLNPNDEDSIAGLFPDGFGGRLAFPKRRRKRKKSEEAREREKIIQNVSRDGFKGRSYCLELDEHSLKTPHVWQAQGCPASYLKAYDVYDHKQRKWRWRHKINTEKWAKSRPE